MNGLALVLPVVSVGLAAEAVEAFRRRDARQRVGRCVVAGAPVRPRGRVGRSDRLVRLLAADRSVPLVVGLGAAAVLGGPAGLLAGVLLGFAARRWLPRPRSPAARRAEREQDRLLRQLPLTAELLAACLGSCSSPARAAAAVAQSVDWPMSERLAEVSAQLSLGAPPESCWEQLGADCPPLAPLARCLVRTTVSGAPPAAALTGLAQAQRAAAGRAAHARVRRAGVLATAPLGACFLPAFVLIGVVPVVIGLTAVFAQRI